MSNYRNLVAIALVVLMALSIYMLVSNAMEKEDELKICLQEAETYAKEGLIGKAVEKYSAAIKIDQDIRYYITVSDLYFNNGQIENSIAWGEEAVDNFPEDPQGYACVIRGNLLISGYRHAFSALEVYDGRGLYSEDVEKYRDEMNSLYDIRGFMMDEVSQPHNGYIVVYKNEAWGLATTKGSTFLKPVYSQMGHMNNGILALCDDAGVWYFANAQGEYIKNISNNIEGTIQEVGIYSEGLFPVRVNNKYAYYTTEFKMVAGGYDYAGAFFNGVAAVRKGNTWSLINSEGKTLGKDTYDQILVDHVGICCHQGIIIAEKQGRYVFLDGNGKKLDNVSFEGAKIPSDDGLIAIKTGDKWGFADNKGNIVIQPQYEEAYSFHNSFAAVKIGGLWGFIGEDNEIRIPAEYQDVRNMSAEGTALVKTDLFWQMIRLYSHNY